MIQARQSSFNLAIRHCGLFALAYPLLSASASAAAQKNEAECSIGYSAGEDLVERIQREGWNFDGYDRLCRVLRANGLKLRITSASGVLTDRAYGWVRVVFERRITGVWGTLGRVSTSMSRTASSPEADAVMYDALSKALTGLAEMPDEYVASVEMEEAKLRRTLSVK